MTVDVRGVIHDVLGSHGHDETILDYIVAVLEDEHFEYGQDGQEAFEQLGGILVRPLVCSKLQTCSSYPCVNAMQQRAACTTTQYE